MNTLWLRQWVCACLHVCVHAFVYVLLVKICCHILLLHEFFKENPFLWPWTEYSVSLLLRVTSLNLWNQTCVLFCSFCKEKFIVRSNISTKYVNINIMKLTFNTVYGRISTCGVQNTMHINVTPLWLQLHACVYR